MMQYDSDSHTFVICAYQESIYLEECIISLLDQTMKTSIAIATSTPNEYIKKLADKYHLPLWINQGEKGIAGDWNFAIAHAKTSLVTLAHQDDVYHRDYAKMVLGALNRCEHPLLAFSDYCEIRNDAIVANNKLLFIKRMMLVPLRLKNLWKSIFVRRRILAMGNAICCPSVTFVKENLQLPLFINNMKSNIDWQAWENISKCKGEFAYIPVRLMKHRIHERSTTSELIEANERKQEDLYMFQKFWPEGIASMIGWFYRSSEKSNTLKRR